MDSLWVRLGASAWLLKWVVWVGKSCWTNQELVKPQVESMSRNTRRHQMSALHPQLVAAIKKGASLYSPQQDNLIRYVLSEVLQQKNGCWFSNSTWLCNNLLSNNEESSGGEEKSEGG